MHPEWRELITGCVVLVAVWEDRHDVGGIGRVDLEVRLRGERLPICSHRDGYGCGSSGASNGAVRVLEVHRKLRKLVWRHTHRSPAPRCPERTDVGWVAPHVLGLNQERDTIGIDRHKNMVGGSLFQSGARPLDVYVKLLRTWVHWDGHLRPVREHDISVIDSGSHDSHRRHKGQWHTVGIHGHTVLHPRRPVRNHVDRVRRWFVLLDDTTPRIHDRLRAIDHLCGQGRLTVEGVAVLVDGQERPIGLLEVGELRWGPGGHDSPFSDRRHPLIPG